MDTLDYIKEQIKHIYNTDPRIHLSVHTTRPKLVVENTPAVIRGVYPNIFRVEENDSGIPRCHSVQYISVLIGEVKIAELDYTPMPTTKK